MQSTQSAHLTDELLASSLPTSADPKQTVLQAFDVLALIARLHHVMADAVTDEKNGRYYPATLTLSQKDMLVDGKRVPCILLTLMPTMS